MITETFDIVILGGGIAGVAAAVKAGRAGVRVLLLERYPFIGGMATAGMVSPFMKYTTAGTVLVRGVFQELQERMRDRQGMQENGFRADAFRFAARQLLQEAGVQVWTRCELISVQRRDRQIESLEALHAATPRRISGRVFIDTSGDAQLVHLADLPTVAGREGSGESQELTLFFRMAGIDFEPVLKQVRRQPQDFFDWVDAEPNEDGIVSIAGFFSLIKAAHAAGTLSTDIDYIFFNSLPAAGEASFNTTAVSHLSANSSAQLTRAERLANAQVHQVVDLLRDQVDGFQNAILLETATQIGVRESRRIVGDVTISGADIRSGRHVPDAVARGCYGVDIHGSGDSEDVMEDLAEGIWYEVPQGSLIARDSDNLLAAGRCLSADFEAHGALRIMPTAAATGEACGAWAALAIQNECPLRRVSNEELQALIQTNLAKN